MRTLEGEGAGTVRTLIGACALQAAGVTVTSIRAVTTIPPMAAVAQRRRVNPVAGARFARLAIVLEF